MAIAPAEYEERTYRTLPFSTQLLLWAVRYWVKSFRINEDPVNFIRVGLAKSGIGGAAEPLNRVMSVLSATSRCTIDVRCVKCAEISVDEERLIAAFAQALKPAHKHVRHEFSGWDGVHPGPTRNEVEPASTAAGWPGTNTVPAGDIGTRARFALFQDLERYLGTEEETSSSVANHSQSSIAAHLLAVWLPPCALRLMREPLSDVAAAFHVADLAIAKSRDVQKYPIGGDVIDVQSPSALPRGHTLH